MNKDNMNKDNMNKDNMNKDNISFQLGIATDNDVPSKNQAETQACNSNIVLAKVINSQSDENLYFFIKEDGMGYAVTHLTLDLWGATNLDNCTAPSLASMI